MEMKVTKEVENSVPQTPDQFRYILQIDGEKVGKRYSEVDGTHVVVRTGLTEEARENLIEQAKERASNAGEKLENEKRKDNPDQGRIEYLASEVQRHCGLVQELINGTAAACRPVITSVNETESTAKFVTTVAVGVHTEVVEVTD